jgi:putative FmdB family regulatory protein
MTTQFGRRPHFAPSTSKNLWSYADWAMTRYDYKCVCGHTEERMMSMKEAPVPLKCPACSSMSLLRQISGGLLAQDIKAPRDKRWPCVSDSLPPWTPGANKYDHEGRPVMESRQMARELGKAAGLNWD